MLLLWKLLKLKCTSAVSGNTGNINLRSILGLITLTLYLFPTTRHLHTPLCIIIGWWWAQLSPIFEYQRISAALTVLFSLDTRLFCFASPLGLQSSERYVPAMHAVFHTQVPARPSRQRCRENPLASQSSYVTTCSVVTCPVKIDQCNKLLVGLNPWISCPRTFRLHF